MMNVLYIVEQVEMDICRESLWLERLFSLEGEIQKIRLEVVLDETGYTAVNEHTHTGTTPIA